MAATYEKISVTYSASSVLSEGAPTDAAIDRLSDALASRMAVAFPGADVTVSVDTRTDADTKIRFYPETYESAAGGSDHERAHSIVGAAWETWVTSLSPADVES